ncbi:Fungal specific transcription factor domain-containing protein [Cladophialophora immunda]|nr:Fungal specific transcription factor domain-containing protein [Cladophialophora immunda]
MMAAALSPYQQPSSVSKARRTNSLAFAKSNCHNCEAIGIRCDRQRPRCTTCQQSGRLCQGYSMQLTWHRNHSTADKPPKVRAALSQAKNGTAASSFAEGSLNHDGHSGNGEGSASTHPRQYMFVAGRPAKRRKRQHVLEGTTTRTVSFDSKRNAPTTELQSPHEATDAYQVPPVVTEYITAQTQVELYSPQLPSPSDATWLHGHLDPDIVTEVQAVGTPDSESLEQCLQIQHSQVSSAAWSPAPSESLDGSLSDTGHLTDSEYTSQISLSYIPQVCFPTLHDKFSGLLDMYDQEFCNYPITSDFSINPYRYRPETTKGSQHLLHAIMAISCHFRLRSPSQPCPPMEALSHKNTAMTLYQGALTETGIYSNALSLLDTALALWQLEATISALNIWRSHLADAYHLLELYGGVRRWSVNRKANVQVSMILWWDAMVSLLARTECVLPYVYLETVLKTEGRHPWTFYQLNGCPRELFVPMMQLANLSGRKWSKTASELVTEIEQSITKYVYPGRGLECDSDEEEAMHTERDRYHCCEGFRYALLIYILRIFKWPRADRPEKVGARILFLSRVCLDHIAACRPTSLIQKQLLFAVFIAGSEARNIAHRELVEEYCRRWYRKFGYQMYMTVLDVMEAVWAKHDAGEDDFWWGDELDARRAEEGDFVQFCFG